MILLYSLFNQITTSHLLIWFWRFFASEEKSDPRKKDQMGYWQSRAELCVCSDLPTKTKQKYKIVIIYSPNKKHKIKKTAFSPNAILFALAFGHNFLWTDLVHHLAVVNSHMVFLIRILDHHYCWHSHLLEADVANNKAHLVPVFRRNVPWTTSTLGFRKLQRVLRDLCTIASLMSW